MGSGMDRTVGLFRGATPLRLLRLLRLLRWGAVCYTRYGPLRSVLWSPNPETAWRGGLPRNGNRPPLRKTAPRYGTRAFGYPGGDRPAI